MLKSFAGHVCEATDRTRSTLSPQEPGPFIIINCGLAHMCLHIFLLQFFSLGMGYMYVAEDFHLEYGNYITRIPPEAVAACCAGTHSPVNPHRQRLLVAAHKATNTLPKPKAKAAKKAPKGKVAKPKAKGNIKTEAAADLETTCKELTPYAEVKKKFVAQLLGWIAACM